MSMCRICFHGEGNATFEAREMMFGSRERFTYVECAGCGCLQIARVPDDLSRHYPEGYYSFAGHRPHRLKRHLKAARARQALGRTSLLGWVTVRLWGMPELASWLRPLHLDPDAAILDVGCGSGDLLLELSDLGFRRLTGVDPFIAHDLHYEEGVSVLRRPISEVEGSFDLVMFHHAFEHVANPGETLQEAARLLRPGGIALIRIPVAGTYAWRTYGADWVQLDAPRHLFLHTEDSMARLARDAGLTIDEIVYDSSAFQFWGSEQYRRDVPLADERSHARDPKNSLFSREQIRQFEVRARELNAAGDGDQACFFLRRSMS
jgi:SAM-dependent methyltransferase